jgi:hypothetical protein
VAGAVGDFWGGGEGTVVSARAAQREFGKGAPRGDFGEARAWWCHGGERRGGVRQGRRRDLGPTVVLSLTGGPSVRIIWPVEREKAY